MENFASTNLNLILGVKEGCHFDRVQKPTIILATLNGQCLETKKIQPGCNPQYATDLMWETDKNALRKMRCNSTPIKVECYAVNDNGSREKLGYILLSVRCAQIIGQGEDSKIKMNWHNVLGVRNEFNNCKPKLMLYLIIKERDSKTVEIASKDKEPGGVDLIDFNCSPKWLQEEHLIQLGPIDTCSDIFLLHVTAESLTNLDQLMQEYQENFNNDFTLIYNIFDMYFKLKSFKLESDNIYLNQKIVIKIRSSLIVLSNYLNSKTYFFIKLKNNSTIVAQSEINLQSLLTSSNLQNEIQINKHIVSARDYHCILKNVYSKESKEDHEKGKHEELPSLKIHIKLLHEKSKDLRRNENEVFQSHYSQLHFKNNDIPPLLNHYHHIEGQAHYPNFNTRVQQISSSEKILHLNKQNNALMQNKESSTETTDIYKTYSLNIKLNSVKFSCSKPDVKNIEFRFYSPRGDVVTAVSNDVSIEAERVIRLQDVKCNLHFIATSNKIEELLSVFAPKINMCDSTSNDKKCLAQVTFDVKKLFQQEEHEYTYTEALIDCKSKSEIGVIEIFVVLKDCSVSPLDKMHQENSEMLFNNKLAYKMVDELESWKERQKEIFKEELQKKEEAHLTLLNKEWQRRRQCLESKLNNSVEQCKALAINLSKTTEDLRKRKIQSFEKETKLIQVNEELQWKYERKLRQLQEALEKMQSEFTIKLRTLEEENQSLIRQIESSNAKNYELEKFKSEQIEKLSTCKKASLFEDQTISVMQQLKILEEKLDNAQKGKKYFKEQWDKSVKEIHSLKIENQKALESQIKSSKEELHNFDLEEILDADSAALRYDRIALNEIQREIDVINPRSSRRCLNKFSGLPKHSLAPQSDVCLSLDYEPVKSDLESNYNASNKKLRKMIEERDALLSTGTYTSEDEIIVKLNADIRSLLMSS